VLFESVLNFYEDNPLSVLEIYVRPLNLELFVMLNLLIIQEMILIQEIKLNPLRTKRKKLNKGKVVADDSDSDQNIAVSENGNDKILSTEDKDYQLEKTIVE
jgi:hypothetical protein